MTGRHEAHEPGDALGRGSLQATLLGFVVLAVGVSGLSKLYGCVFGVGLGDRDDRPEPPPPVPARLVAFLGPIAPGHALDGWTVTEVGPLKDGALRLVLTATAGEVATLTLRMRDPHGARGLVETGALAVFGDEGARRAARALAPALAAQEQRSPPPPDLTMATP